MRRMETIPTTAKSMVIFTCLCGGWNQFQRQQRAWYSLPIHVDSGTSSNYSKKHGILYLFIFYGPNYTYIYSTVKKLPKHKFRLKVNFTFSPMKTTVELFSEAKILFSQPMRASSMPEFVPFPANLHSHLCISFLGIARPQSQFPHSRVFELFIYSQDGSTYFPAAE